MKVTDDPTENISGITDDHQNYKKCDCSRKVENKAEDFLKFQSVTKDWDFHNLQLYFSLFELLSSQPDCFRVNEIIFIMIKILITLGDQSD